MSATMRFLPLFLLIPLLGCGGPAARRNPPVQGDPAAPSAPEVTGPEVVHVGTPTEYQLRSIDPQELPISYRTQTPNAVIQGDKLTFLVTAPGTVDLTVWAENTRNARSSNTTRRITATASGVLP